MAPQLKYTQSNDLPSLADSGLHLVPCMPVVHDMVLVANFSTSFFVR